MKYFIVLVLFFYVFAAKAQHNRKGETWLAQIKRKDSVDIPFSFELRTVARKQVIVIKNAAERIMVDQIIKTGDSMVIKMPVFESSITVKVKGDKWMGYWNRSTSSGSFTIPFEALKNAPRFVLKHGSAKLNFNGRWAVNFESDSGKLYKSVAEFKQKGNNITGTILTPTGDYRYLEGIVTGKQLKLSGFDGSHAVLFQAELKTNKILAGKYFSGPKYSEGWTAVKNTSARVKFEESAMFVKPGENRLSFQFPDLDSNIVSVNDTRFANKVVIIQLMGSWCPNCMDETRFLSDYYNKYNKKGIEIIALAYEYSTDFERSKNSLLKFKNRFNVQYPILITGVKVTDTLRTEKTLPQLTKIKVFPSSVILDKKGVIRKLDNGFVGPATGIHYERYKNEFYTFIDKLLKE